MPIKNMTTPKNQTKQKITFFFTPLIIAAQPAFFLSVSTLGGKSVLSLLHDPPPSPFSHFLTPFPTFSRPPPPPYSVISYLNAPQGIKYVSRFLLEM